MGDNSLDIEVALKEDKTGEYKKVLLGEILEEATSIKNQPNKVVSQEEYRQLDALLKATEAAGEVVEQVWQQAHLN